MNKWLSVVEVTVSVCTVVKVLPCLSFIHLFLGKGAREDGDQGPEAVFSVHGTRAHSNLSQTDD